MGDAFVYDKSDYHMGNGADTWEKASGTALFILRWMIARNFLEPEFWDAAAESLAKYRAGQMSLFELYEKECDLSLVDDLFSPEGNAFGQPYFDYSNGRYLGDLESVLHFGKNYPEFSEEAYQRVGPVIDARYEAWKRGEGDLTRPPESKARQTLKKVLGFFIVAAMFAAVYFFAWFLNWMFYPRN